VNRVRVAQARRLPQRLTHRTDIATNASAENFVGSVDDCDYPFEEMWTWVDD
jgi:hypothetical protein